MSLRNVKVGDQIFVRQRSHSHGRPPQTFPATVSKVGRIYLTAYQNPDHPTLTMRFDREEGRGVDCFPAARAWASRDDFYAFERTEHLQRRAEQAMRSTVRLRHLNDEQLQQLIDLLTPDKEQ